MQINFADEIKKAQAAVEQAAAQERAARDATSRAMGALLAMQHLAAKQAKAEPEIKTPVNRVAEAVGVGNGSGAE